VIYPPVAIETFYWKPEQDFFLMASELVAYKRLDYVVRLFSRNGRRLKVVGDGPEFRKLQRLAGSSIEFCGRVSDAELRELFATCRALIVPGEEDFGMSMVEALASGKPVVALGRGGALEIAGPNCGVLYAEPSEVSLSAALERLDTRVFNESQLQAAALRFSEWEFVRRMDELLECTVNSAAC
jgi:glycosyltransferase involved in cell wall biosynthesis